MLFYSEPSHKTRHHPRPSFLNGYYPSLKRDRRQWDEATRREIVYGEMSVLTDGAFTLCGSRADLPPQAGLLVQTFSITCDTLSLLCEEVYKAVRAVGMAAVRRGILMVAVSEAATNVVGRRGSCIARIGFRAGAASPATFQVWLTSPTRDIGAVDPTRSNTPTPSPHSSQAQLLGETFEAVRAVDNLWLLSGEAGTTIVMEQAAHHATRQ